MLVGVQKIQMYFLAVTQIEFSIYIYISTICLNFNKEQGISFPFTFSTSNMCEIGKVKRKISSLIFQKS